MTNGATDSLKKWPGAYLTNWQIDLTTNWKSYELANRQSDKQISQLTQEMKD